MNGLSLRRFSPSVLRRSRFIEDLLSSALSDGFLGEDAFSKLKDGLALSVLNFAMKNKADGVSSMSAEYFGRLSNAALFYAGLSLSDMSPGDALEKLLSLRFEKLIDDGSEKAISLFERSKAHYLNIRENSFLSDNAFLNDFIASSLPEFFSSMGVLDSDEGSPLLLFECDEDFDFSCPVVKYAEDAAGIEKVESYLFAFRAENAFLQLFEPSAVNALTINDPGAPTFFDPFLGGADFSAPEFFPKALIAACELMLCGKAPWSLKPTDDDRAHIALLKSGKAEEDILNLYQNVLEALIEGLSPDDSEKEYIKKALRIVLKA